MAKIASQLQFMEFALLELVIILVSVEGALKFFVTGVRQENLHGAVDIELGVVGD